jgi:CheY-like chemotaxis protein
MPRDTDALVLCDDEKLRTTIEAVLSASGWNPLQSPTLSLGLIILAERGGALSGRQQAVSFRSQAAFFQTPMVAVTTDESFPSALRWLRVGAVDILSETSLTTGALTELLRECDESQIHTAPARQRVLAYARRRQLAGTLLSYPDTPFEAELRFDAGELTRARFTSYTGNAALDAVIGMDEGPFRWTPGAELAVLPKFESRNRSRILVVEDDAALCALTVKRLEGAGYAVTQTSDGKTGLQLALTQSFDVAVLDLNLPTLDGWGLLRHMRESISARETAVMLVSAHNSFVDTLKAARAGARAYLHKSGRAKELLQSVELLVQPRHVTRAALLKRLPIKIETRSLGPVWLLRTLGELDCMGRLELEDEIGRYEVTVGQGQLMDISAQVGSMRYQGDVALEALISARASGHFVSFHVKYDEKKPWIFDVLDRVCKNLTDNVRAKLNDNALKLSELTVNGELAQLYGQIASVQELRILEAAMQTPSSVEVLSEQLSIPASDVEATLAELLRRGVFSVKETS